MTVIMTEPQTTSAPPTVRLARTLAVTSGKGGVGKTFFSANLAAALTRQGLKVLVLDADLGLANLDVVLNLYPKITLHDVFTGKAQLEEAILPAPGGFSVLLAGSGLVEYSRLTSEIREQLMGIMTAVAPRFDVLLLDTGAGISDVVLFALSLAHEIIVVATPEPTSMTDAYATIKVLASQQGREQMHLVINQVGRVGEGRTICQQLQQVVERFVQTPSGVPPKLNFMGDIPLDPSVREAVRRRSLLLELHPGCPASQGVVQIATKLCSGR
ncbi:MAG: MinD/ParA family protein [Rubrivivax sp.]|nr:MAG: MinD/ParA family protein [Rubrivivax sp.]